MYIKCASMCTSDEQKGDEKMTKPLYISGDDEERTLRDYVEWFALGLAYNAVNGEKNETLQSECKILDSLTNALNAIKL